MDGAEELKLFECCSSASLNLMSACPIYSNHTLCEAAHRASQASISSVEDSYGVRIGPFMTVMCFVTIMMMMVIMNVIIFM